MNSALKVGYAIVAAGSMIVLASCQPAPTAEAASTSDTPQAASEPDTGPDTGNVTEAAGMPATNVQDLLTATVIHWSAVGDYAGDVMVLDAGTNGYAPVTDHVEFAYDFTLEGNTGLTGTPTFKNFPSTTGALRNGAEGCRAPTISGAPYEHWTIEKIEQGIGGAVALTVRSDFPEGQVPVACTGGNQPSPARAKATHVELPIPSVSFFMMGDQLTGDIQLSADKRSIIHKRDGWTFVYTPRKVR